MATARIFGREDVKKLHRAFTVDLEPEELEKARLELLNIIERARRAHTNADKKAKQIWRRIIQKQRR
jgi:hypothetical protein